MERITSNNMFNNPKGNVYKKLLYHMHGTYTYNMFLHNMEESFERNINLDKKICVYLKNYSCLYDKTHENYYLIKVKDKAFNEIAAKINSDKELNVLLTGAIVKKEWENIRRTFVRKFNKPHLSKYYLYNELQFLIPHVMKKYQCLGSTESDEPSTSKTQDIEVCSEKNDKIIPPVSQCYFNKKTHLEELEMKVLKNTSTAMENINILMKDSDNEEIKDNFVLCIQQSLQYVPSTHVLECVNGILTIMDKFMISNEE
ncbi:uncharacterized protein LOC131671083 isoform X1 [Phymastichus coffea]|uniref:uncharacterized protein LOC131671083 isoform X1 n=2 Tax=Phymastichus coffea TaxID=108790 RepID=UPI00273CD075|nr:uncharacterized protein LOC131671083 isoform X1 [Phymastichus coffea]